MSTATIERLVERPSEMLSDQMQRAAIASPRPYWPLPGTQLPKAHFTWPEWVALLDARLASARNAQEEMSATSA